MAVNRIVHVYISDKPMVDLSSYVVFGKGDKAVTLTIDVRQVTDYRVGVWSLEVEQNTWQFTTVVDNVVVDASGTFFWLVKPEILNRTGQIKFRAKHYVTAQNVVTREFQMFSEIEEFFHHVYPPHHHPIPGMPPCSGMPPGVPPVPIGGTCPPSGAGSYPYHNHCDLPLNVFVAFQKTLGEMQAIKDCVSNLHREAKLDSRGVKELYASIGTMYEVLMKAGSQIVFLADDEILPSVGQLGKLYVSVDVYTGYIKIFVYDAALFRWREVGFQTLSKTEDEWKFHIGPIPDGQVAYSRDMHKFKIGNGVTTYSALPFYGMDDGVTSWAGHKGAVKPVTGDVAETTNLYFTEARVATVIASSSIEDLLDGDQCVMVSDLEEFSAQEIAALFSS